MQLRLYNTLTGKKEKFTPLRKGEVGVYTCGPTVYNYAHIGNLRAYVFADTLRRALEFTGYKVKQVMNVTDVGQLTSDADEGEDKMVKGLTREGKPLTLEAMSELGEFYTIAFAEDLKALNIKVPREMPRASLHIAEDIGIIKTLEEKGFAYRTSDGVYFDTSQFPSYGTRGGFKLGDLKEGARVAVNTEKRNPADFALWKFGSGAIGWDSPWGPGFPGWHIECSAMSRKYLGQPFDIHTGGIDHVPVHHQNEIAQSEAAFGVPLANYWMHNEYLVVPSGKMAKSGENFVTLQTVKERGIHPLSYRYFLLQTHYRSPLTFSWDALEAAQTGFENLLFAIRSFSHDDMAKKDVLYTEGTIVYENALRKAMEDDLGTPAALGALNSLVHHSPSDPKEKRELVFGVFEHLLGLKLKELSEQIGDIPKEIAALASEHDAVREKKDWKKSGEIRDVIIAKGYRVQNLSGVRESLVTRRLSSLR